MRPSNKPESGRWRRILPPTLTCVAGYIDAIGYLLLAKLFIGAMSGNTVLLGITTAQGDWGGLALRAVAMLAFACSIAVGAILPGSVRGTPLLAEAALLAGFIVAGNLAGLQTMHDPIAALPWTAFIVFSVGLQNVVLRRSGQHSVRGTTYVTGLIANAIVAIVDATKARISGDEPSKHARDAREHGAMLAGFLAGGVVGALAYLRVSFQALWVAVAILVAAGIVDLRLPENPEYESGTTDRSDGGENRSG